MTGRKGRVAGAGLVALDVVVLAEGHRGALTYAGGTCGNVLSILSYLNWCSEAVGYLGDDPAGKIVMDDLSKAGVSARHLHQKPGAKTPVFVQQLQLNEQGGPRHTFVSSCPECGQMLGSKSTPVTPIQSFSEEEVLDVFFMDRLSEDILLLAASAKAQGATVFYEPSAKADRQFWADAFTLVDIVKYSGDRFDSEELAPFTRSSAALWEVQTLGAKGLKYRHHSNSRRAGGEWKFSPAFSAPRLIDTCGAGDWTSSGLLHHLISATDRTSEDAFASAVRFGQVLGAWACAFVGARGAMYASDVEETWRALSALENGRAVDMSLWPASENQRGHAAPYCYTDTCASK